jgi:hypothetical protein
VALGRRDKTGKPTPAGALSTASRLIGPHRAKAGHHRRPGHRYRAATRAHRTRGTRDPQLAPLGTAFRTHLNRMPPSALWGRRPHEGHRCTQSGYGASTSRGHSDPRAVPTLAPLGSEVRRGRPTEGVRRMAERARAGRLAVLAVLAVLAEGVGHLPMAVTHRSTVRTSAGHGNTFSVSTWCTSGSASRQPSARTVRPKSRWRPSAG